MESIEEVNKNILNKLKELNTTLWFIFQNHIY
jgi:hypothetical protein